MLKIYKIIKIIKLYILIKPTLQSSLIKYIFKLVLVTKQVHFNYNINLFYYGENF